MKLEERTFGTPCIFLTNLLKICLKYIDIFVLFFCLPLHRLAVRNSLPFHDFLQVIIYCTEPGLQLGDPAPLKGFVAVDLLIFYILVKTQSTGLHMDALSTPVFYR